MMKDMLMMAKMMMMMMMMKEEYKRTRIIMKGMGEEMKGVEY